MRYLYGDSVPFPQQYDFLAALDIFCTQAARVVRLDAESRGFQRSAEEAVTGRAHAVEALEAFHKEAVGALRDGSQDQGQPLIDDYVRQVSEVAQRIVDEVRRHAAATSEREQVAARTEWDRRRAETRDAVEKLLIAVRLLATDTQIRMVLSGGLTNDISGRFAFDGGLVAAFALAAEAVEDWQRPRRVGDLASGLTLPVGVRRSLFKRTVAPETITLDDYVLGGFELHDDHAELRLRKKPELADSLVFSLRRTDDHVLAEVHYPEDAEAESGLPAALDVSSAAEMERLWQVVRNSCGPVLSRKKTLITLSLEGADVFEGALATKVVEHVVRAIAPTVQDIARRSPNAQELSLKLESDSGRREEIYLKKSQLVTALATVPAEARAVFDPLGILPTEPRDTIESLNDGARAPVA